MAWTAVIAALALVSLCAPMASAQPKIELKLAYFVGDQHAMSQWLVRWSDGSRRIRAAGSR